MQKLALIQPRTGLGKSDVSQDVFPKYVLSATGRGPAHGRSCSPRACAAGAASGLLWHPLSSRQTQSSGKTNGRKRKSRENRISFSPLFSNHRSSPAESSKYHGHLAFRVPKNFAKHRFGVGYHFTVKEFIIGSVEELQGSAISAGGQLGHAGPPAARECSR